MALRENGETILTTASCSCSPARLTADRLCRRSPGKRSCYRKEQKTLPHRHNSTTFYFAFEGEGAVVIENERLQYQQGDIFAVPAWTWHHHENTHNEDTILFSIDDWPAMKKLGFYMKEEAKGF